MLDISFVAVACMLVDTSKVLDTSVGNRLVVLAFAALQTAVFDLSHKLEIVAHKEVFDLSHKLAFDQKAVFDLSHKQAFRQRVV